MWFGLADPEPKALLNPFLCSWTGHLTRSASLHLRDVNKCGELSRNPSKTIFYYVLEASALEKSVVEIFVEKKSF